MSLVGRLHGNLVFGRRVRVLSEQLAALLPTPATVLDVGCGDGTMAHLLMQLRPDIQISGIDVLVRPTTQIQVTPFDGKEIPFAAGSFDVVMFTDVLHHTEDPLVLLREAVRVARTAIVIKDHTRDGWLAGPTLRLMDYVGNAHHGVVLPYNYWPRARWVAAFAELKLRVSKWQSQLGLYPAPASWLFDRSLHFVARLDLS
jgi:SAM-dependent methyltransferase